MKFSQSIIALSVAAGIASAAPLTERQAPAITDGMPTSSPQQHAKNSPLIYPTS